jgi:hypothetical protein
MNLKAENHMNVVGFEVLTLMTTKSTVFGILRPYSSTEVHVFEKYVSSVLGFEDETRQLKTSRWKAKRNLFSVQGCRCLPSQNFWLLLRLLFYPSEHELASAELHGLAV